MFLSSFFASLGRRWRERAIRKRLLFDFHDGERVRYLDPFKAWRDIQSHPTYNFATNFQFIDVGKEPETSDCIKALCEIFGVERWNDRTMTGMTDYEILNVCDGVLQYCDALKKNGNPGPIESEPTDLESSISPADPDAATKPSQDSVSTPSESSCETRCESSTESKPPSPNS